MAAVSPTMLQITQKITKLRTEVPFPNSWLNPKYIVTLVVAVAIFIVVRFHSSRDLDLEANDLVTDHMDNPNPEEVKVNKSSLVIFTRYRSGSSLIGELFNRHPDVFYIFEPFKLLPAGLEWNTFIRNKASTYLLELTHCNFQRIINDSVSLPNAQENTIKSWMPRSFCGKVKVTEDTADDLKCRKASLQSFEHLCRQYSWVVTKTIRIYDVMALVPYLQQDQKVVSLLRDPRGMISSRMKIEQIKRKQNDERYFRDMGLRLREVRIQAEKTCGDIRENLLTISQLVNEVPEFLKLYYTIRYEDFAENPVEQAKLLYRFAGLNFHQSVHDWLLSATSGVDVKKHKQGSLKYSYGTTRQSSTETASAWRNHLPYKIVKAIQKICYKELVVLGYVPVSNIIELADMDFKLHKNFSLPWFQ